MAADPEREAADRAYLCAHDADVAKAETKTTAAGQTATLHCLFCRKRRFDPDAWQTKTADELVGWGQLMTFCSLDCFRMYLDLHHPHPPF